MEGLALDHLLLRAALAFLLGGLIGYERTYHGRPAGFRTHILVCLASTLLMAWASSTVTGSASDTLRMAQGLMTGIGFLGAGVIVKEKLTVRGLTTAASIWMTAALGILVGAGDLRGGVVAALLTLATLLVLRGLERIIPTLHYANLAVTIPHQGGIPEEELGRLISSLGIVVSARQLEHMERGGATQFEFSINTRRRKNFRLLCERLGKAEGVSGFTLKLAEI